MSVAMCSYTDTFQGKLGTSWTTKDYKHLQKSTWKHDANFCSRNGRIKLTTTNKLENPRAKSKLPKPATNILVGLWWDWTRAKCNNGQTVRTYVERGYSLQWHHNGLDGVSNHQPHHCLLSRLFGHRLKKASKLRVTGLCAHKGPVTRKMFPFDDVIMVISKATMAQGIIYDSSSVVSAKFCNIQTEKGDIHISKWKFKQDRNVLASCKDRLVYIDPKNYELCFVLFWFGVDRFYPYPLTLLALQ